MNQLVNYSDLNISDFVLARTMLAVIANEKPHQSVQNIAQQKTPKGNVSNFSISSDDEEKDYSLITK